MAMSGRFSCVEHTRYQTKADAQHACTEMQRRMRREGILRGKPRVFRCGVCEGWHVGRGKRSK